MRIEETLAVMIRQRPTVKLERAKLVAQLALGLVSKPGASAEDQLRRLRAIVESWQVLQRTVANRPPAIPSQAEFQDLGMLLHHVSDGVVSEELAFDLAAWLEAKFTSGKHPCWARFLDNTVGRPLGLDRELMPMILLPIEASVHVFDDYIDSVSSTPSHDAHDCGLGAVAITMLPLLLRKAAQAHGAPASNGDLAWAAYCGSVEEVLRVPAIEDESPARLRAARGDLRREAEAGAFNIDSRGHATTRLFMATLTALLPQRKDVADAWAMLRVSRVMEMCAKDAVFDVEADILNADHTPASVWAEDFGVGSPEWAKRISALLGLYLDRWSALLAERGTLPASLVAAIESRIQKNRFLIESLVGDALERPAGLRAGVKIYMVGSGKGGVGKSTVTWLLANTLRDRGLKVGVVDADIWGPSQDLLFGRSGSVSFAGLDVVPAECDGVTVVSLGQFVDPNDAILLKSVMAARLLKRLALGVRWPQVDALLVDLPPGGSDIHIQLRGIFPEAEVVLVTLGQPLAMADTSRALTIYSVLGQKVSGLVMNMKMASCPSCGSVMQLGASLSKTSADGEALGALPLLAELPFDARLSALGGVQGAPWRGDGALAKAMAGLTARLLGDGRDEKEAA